MQFKNFKSLASTHIKKSILLLVISSISVFMLCSCGNNEDSASIETDATEESTTTDTQEVTESTTEQTELENQDKDPTEATTQGTTQQTTQGTTQNNNTTQPTTTQTPTTENPAHVHTWVLTTGYRTEVQTVHHDAVYETIHHEASTGYTTETQTIHHDVYNCNNCGAAFDSETAINAHIENNMDCFLSGAGYGHRPGNDEQVEVQVPYEIPAYDEQVLVSEAYDETVNVQVPYEYYVCSDCNATKDK